MILGLYSSLQLHHITGSIVWAAGQVYALIPAAKDFLAGCTCPHFDPSAPQGGMPHTLSHRGYCHWQSPPILPRSPFPAHRILPGCGAPLSGPETVLQQANVQPVSCQIPIYSPVSAALLRICFSLVFKGDLCYYYKNVFSEFCFMTAKPEDPEGLPPPNQFFG